MLLANQDMSLMDAVLLDQVQKGKPINDNAIKKLRKEGLIEGMFQSRSLRQLIHRWNIL